MSTDPDTFDTRTDADRPADFETEPRDDRSSLRTRSILVEYEDKPDRRTVYPAGLSSTERMATWLTADDDAFLDLDSTR